MELKHNQLAKVSSRTILLIVPYGIETVVEEAVKLNQHSFNRTLWN